MPKHRLPIYLFLLYSACDKHFKGEAEQLETELRKKAIQRYLQGEKPKSIYTDFKRSKKWFFKWLKRYLTGQKDWYQDQSRAPRSSPRRICEAEKQRIIEVRKMLKAEPFAQTGTSAIKWELDKSGFSFPSDRTINRVLKREGLVKKKCLRAQGC